MKTTARNNNIPAQIIKVETGSVLPISLPNHAKTYGEEYAPKLFRIMAIEIARFFDDLGALFSTVP